MRWDIVCENDSGGFSLVSSRAAAQIAAVQATQALRFVQAHQALLFELVADSPLTARVVLNSPLSQEEEKACLNQIMGCLDLRCGQLLICGGFDPVSLNQWLKESWDSYIHVLEVDPGWYQVRVSATLVSLNGQALQAGGLEAWLEKDPQPTEPAVPYGWVIQLLPAEESTAKVALTQPGSDGWFSCEAGILL